MWDLRQKGIAKYGEMPGYAEGIMERVGGTDERYVEMKKCLACEIKTEEGVGEMKGRRGRSKVFHTSRSS